MRISRIFKYLKSALLLGRAAAMTSEEYLDFLRSKGVEIGEGTYAIDPASVQIDYSRPELVRIGRHVFLHRGTVIMSHDWAGWCFVYSHNEFIPSHGRVSIGDNVWLGENVTICKGVSVGSNCIIGTGSVVTRSIPDNSVAVGVPARVICSYEEYYEKRKKEYVSECVEYARAIRDSGKELSPEQFYDDYPCFVDAGNYKEYDYPYERVFSGEGLNRWLDSHQKVFDGFDGLAAAAHKSER